MDLRKTYDFSEWLFPYRVLDNGYSSLATGYEHVLGEYESLSTEYTSLQKSFEVVFYDWSHVSTWK